MIEIIPILPINTNTTNNPIIKIFVVFEICSIRLLPSETRLYG